MFPSRVSFLPLARGLTRLYLTKANFHISPVATRSRYGSPYA